MKKTEEQRKKDQEYYQRNKESVKKKVRKYKKNNPDLIKKLSKRYYKENKKQIQDYKQRYKRTDHGLIRRMYGEQRLRSKRKGFPEPQYTFEELKEWCLSQEIFHKLYNEWVKSDYDVKLKPSIDRINPLKHYYFGNIQLLTWGKNEQKGHHESFITQGKPVIKFGLDNKYISIYYSGTEASRKNKTPVHRIRRSCNKKTQTGGFKWRYEKDCINDLFFNVPTNSWDID